MSLRFLQAVNADRTATASRAVDNGQARRLMIAEFAPRFVHVLVRTTTRRRRPHDLSDTNLRRTAVISRYAATHVALGDDADDLKVVCILDDRRAAAA